MPLRRLYFPLPVALCLSILFLSFVIAPRYAHALASPSGPITITSRTYVVHFPSSIEINVSANDPISTIAKASIDIDLSVDAQQEIHTIPLTRRHIQYPYHGTKIQVAAISYHRERRSPTSGNFGIARGIR